MVRLFSVFACALLLLASCGESTKKTDPETPAVDPADKPQEPIEKEVGLNLDDMKKAQAEYNLPTPGEIFLAMGKIDEVDWKKHATSPTETEYSTDHEKSFWMGVCVADAFVAVQAKNHDDFSEMSRTVFDISKGLGIDALLEETKAKIDEISAETDPMEQKQSIDELYFEMVGALDSIHQGDLLYTYSSLGSWSETVRVIGGHCKDNFSEEAASLLFEPRLVEELLNKLAENKVEGFDGHDALITNLESALKTIKEGSDNITPDSVSKLVDAANTVFNTIKGA